MQASANFLSSLHPRVPRFLSRTSPSTIPTVMDETDSVESSDAQPGTLPTAAAPLSNADVDNILSSSGRNRQRIRKACYPCNKRKIKCDRDERVPCGNCAKRPHPELCTFDDHAPRSVPPRSRTSNGLSRSSPHSSSMARSRQYPNTPDQPLLHGIHSASAAYDREYHPNGQSNGYSTWADPRSSEDAARRTAEPRSSIVPEYSYARDSGFQSVNTPSSNGAKRVALGQPSRPAWDFAPPRSEPSTFWDRISPLLPPQKHLLR